jgi:hypothetical protein
LADHQLESAIKTYSDWDFTIKHAESVGELTQSEREKAVEGIRSLREILGEDWLSKVLVSRHPVTRYVINRAPWTRVWLGEFGEMLEHLRGSSNFAKLVEKLSEPRLFSATYFELQVAHDFGSAGYVVEFYPEWKRGEYDFAVSRDGLRYAVEASVINDAEEARWANKTFGALAMPYVFVPGTFVIGKLFKALSERRIADLKKRVDQAVKKAQETKQSTEVLIPGIIDYFVYPEGKQQEALEWARSRGLEVALEGPPPAHEYDEIGRLAKSLKEEYRQLPKDLRGIVALLDDRLWFTKGEDLYPGLVAKLEEDVYALRNLSLLVIYTNDGPEIEAPGHGPGYVISKRPRAKLYSTLVAAIANAYGEPGDVELLDVYERKRGHP